MIMKNKRAVHEVCVNGVSSVYGMANLKPSKTGLPFEVWIDEIGSDRNIAHNLPRFKVRAGGTELDIVLSENGVAKIVNKDTRQIQKFGYAKEATDFIEKFSEPLLMHWKGEIDSFDVLQIIRIALKNNYSPEKATEIVLNKNCSDDEY